MKTQIGGQEKAAVRVRVGGHWLNGDLALPIDAPGIVLFAHGSGSSRHSPRNRFVASSLEERGLGTLLMDLLTVEEELLDARTAQFRFDIDLLAGRLVAIVDWLKQREDTAPLSIGLFGASTGAAAALMAAAARPSEVGAVVSRGGRPDLAGSALAQVVAPTLLIVGGYDDVVIGLNREAMARMTATAPVLEIVPRATHLFEEPGALEEVAGHAGRWFQRYLRAGDRE